MNIKRVLSRPHVTLFATMLLLIATSACEDFVDVGTSNSNVTADLVFSDNNTAESAVIGIYYDLIQSAFAGGTRNNLSVLTGLSADELSDYNLTDGVIQFERNELSADNSNVLVLWQSIYKTVYQANSVIEGLTTATTLSASVKDQLIGEAKFLRAFSHFYSTNLFGDVPLVVTSDYRKNSVSARTPAGMVYEQILADLLSAHELLPDSYDNNERVRATKSAGNALLARIYLYLGDWSRAETHATAVIDHNQYNLLSNLNGTFLKNNREAIWQLPPVIGNNTYEALYFVPTQTSSKYLVLQDGLINAFEPGDNRRNSWTGMVDVDGEQFYFPHKYKLYPSTSPVAEYQTILRLAEQYLIRAEARAQRGDIVNAIADLDVIRNRAGLPLVSDVNPGITQGDLLLAIEQERRVELFSEWGHRWLDLKRTRRTEAVLALTKTGFVPEDELYPIPDAEINKNPMLGSQNPGY